jgi:hypothetical protein
MGQWVEPETRVYPSCDFFRRSVPVAAWRPWVAGCRDDVVEDDVLGQQVEEVPTIRNAIEAFSMMRKNGSSAVKSSRSVIVVILRLSSRLCTQARSCQ